jgi:Holliday junction DNA helicase RuvA
LIGKIRGNLSYRSLTQIIVDVNGVGYQISIPLSTYYSLPELNESLTLFISTYIREDVLTLFGFFTLEEKEMFEALISVSKIGPKMALNILSGIPVQELKEVIIKGEIQKLHAIPGIGLKTAERVALELKDKIKPADTVPSFAGPDHCGLKDDKLKDALSALINLGYSKSQAEKAIKEVSLTFREDISLERLIKESLKNLVQHKLKL